MLRWKNKSATACFDSWVELLEAKRRCHDTALKSARWLLNRTVSMAFVLSFSRFALN